MEGDDDQQKMVMMDTIQLIMVITGLQYWEGYELAMGREVN